MAFVNWSGGRAHAAERNGSLSWRTGSAHHGQEMPCGLERIRPLGWKCHSPDQGQMPDEV